MADSKLNRNSKPSYSVIVPAIVAFTTTIYGFNHVMMPIVERHLKGPIWLRFVIAAPPALAFSSVCSHLTGRVLASSTCDTAVSSPSIPPSQDDNFTESRTSSTL